MTEGAEQSNDGSVDPEMVDAMPVPGPVRLGMAAQQYMEQARERAERSGKIGDIEFDEAGIDTIIERIGRVRTQWEDNKKLAKDLQIIDPGAEYASGQYAEAANAMGESYLAYLDRNIDAYDKFIELLEQTKRDYLAHEQEVADTIGGIQT